MSSDISYADSDLCLKLRLEMLEESYKKSDRLKEIDELLEHYADDTRKEADAISIPFLSHARKILHERVRELEEQWANAITLDPHYEECRKFTASERCTFMQPIFSREMMTVLDRMEDQEQNRRKRAGQGPVTIRLK